jgi:hypothetical protein
MALTSLSDNAWKALFQNFGRLTMMRNIIGGDQPTFQSGVVIAAQKLAEEDFILTSGMLPTFLNNMSTLSANLTSGQTNITTAMTSLITGQIKPDINSDATTASGILNDMFSLMRTDSIAISGVTGLFNTMFQEVFGFLPHFYPKFSGAQASAGHVLPDTGTPDIPIFEGYAVFDWNDWDTP